MEKERNIGEAKLVGQPKAPFRFKLKDGCVKSNHLAEESVATGNIQNGAVSTEKIMDEAVTNAKIMNGAITNSKISNGTITNEKIANNSIDNSKIQDLTLTGAKFINNSIDGNKIMDNSIPGSKLADGAIESVDLQDGTLDGRKLVDNSVDGDKLVEGAVTSEKLKDNSIDGSKIADGTIQSLDIKDGTISGSKLVDNSIPGTKLSDGIINNNKIANNTITGDKFLDESISGEKIQPNTIHGSKLETGTVDGADIIAGTLDGNKIANMSVDGDKLADDSIETRHIKSNTISGSKIVTNSIDSTKIRNNSLIGENFADGAITNAKIVDNTVTNSKIANNTITSDKIVDGAITTDKLANSSVGGTSIADNAITNAKLQDNSIVNRNISTGTLTGDKFVDNTITGDKIQDNTVSGSKLKDGTIESVDIKDGTLSGTKLVNNSVDGAKLADNSITSSHLIDNSIPGSKIKDGTIENVDIKDNTLDGSKLKDGSILTAKIYDGAVTNTKIAAEAITTDKIDNLAVTESKLATGAVTNGKIANDAVTENKLSTGSVTVDKIADGSVTEAKLGTGAVTNTKLVDSSVTENKIGTGAVTTDKINNNAVTTDKIADLNVTTAKIADSAVTEDKLADGAITSDKIADDAITELQTIMDEVPTEGSVKPVMSGGVQNELALGAVYDVSAKNPTAGLNNDGKWESLSALLSDANLNTLIPTAYRKGGMSIKFVLSSDNMYVQFRYMLQYENTTAGNNAFKNVNNWQGVDEKLLAGSKNLAESGIVYNAINPIVFKPIVDGAYINSQLTYIEDSNWYIGTLVPIKLNDVITYNTPSNVIDDSPYKAGYYDAALNPVGSNSIHNGKDYTVSQLEIDAGAKYVALSTRRTDANEFKISVNGVQRYQGLTQEEINKTIDGIDARIVKNELEIYKKQLYSISGKGSTFVSKNIPLIKNRKYRIIFDNPSWARNNTGSTAGEYIFAISSYNGAASTLIFVITRGNDTGTFNGTYDFIVPDNSDYIQIGGRANDGTDIVFSIEDVSNTEQCIVELYGSNTTFLETKIKLLRNRTYRLVLENPNYAQSNVGSGFIFAIRSLSGSTVTRFTKSECMNGNIPNKVFDFTVPNDSDYIVVCGRANVGTTIRCLVYDVTDIVFDYASVYDNTVINTAGGQISADGYMVTPPIPIKRGDYIEWCGGFVRGNDAPTITALVLYNQDGLRLESREATSNPRGMEIYVANVAFVRCNLKKDWGNVYVKINNNIVYALDEHNYNTSLNTTLRGIINNNKSISDRNEDKIDLLRAASNNGRRLQLLVATDAHEDWTALQNAVDFANQCPYIDALLLSGDNCGESVASLSVFEHYNQIVNTCNKPVLSIPGNHDAGYEQWLTCVASNDVIYQYITQPSIKSLVNGEYEEGKPYFYHDFSSKKIRVICLNEFDENIQLEANSYWQAIEYDASYDSYVGNTEYAVDDCVNFGLYTANSFKCLVAHTSSNSNTIRTTEVRGYRFIGETQMNWLVSTMLSTPAGYGLIICTHVPASNDFSTMYRDNKFCSKYLSDNLSYNAFDSDVLGKLVDDFNKGQASSILVKGKGTFTYMNTQTIDGESCAYKVQYDFSNKNTGAKFLVFCCGHTHVDMIMKNSLGSYSISPTYTTAITRQFATNDVPRSSDDSQIARDALTVVAFDYDHDGVILTRVGTTSTTDGYLRDVDRLDLTQ